MTVGAIGGNLVELRLNAEPLVTRAVITSSLSDNIGKVGDVFSVFDVSQHWTHLNDT